MQTGKIQIQQIHPGIFLRKQVVNNEQLSYIFQLEVHDLTMIDFQADFTGSQNIIIKGIGEQMSTVLKTVQPRNKTLIAVVQLHQGWKLKTVFRFMKRPISKDKQIMYIKPEVDVIQTQKKTIEAIFKNEQVGLLPLDQINDRLSKSKIKFVDQNFPPQQQSILGKADKSLIDDTVNHWRRPDQIFQGKPYYLFRQINYKNLSMGKLLDNAFFSVVVTLAYSHQSLIQRLFLTQGHISQNGIYQLRICKNGEWQKVTIDDYIPCEPLSKPKFACNALNQIWIHLLQKAYAKTHNQYISLYQLEVSSVFNDLTGCPTIIVPTNSEDIKKILQRNLDKNNIVVFFEIEQRQFDEDNFVPYKNYAYPLLSCEEDDGKMYYKFLSHTLAQDEICQTDLRKTFRYVCICKVQNWDQVRIKGKFISINSGNPQNQNNITLSRWYYSIQLHEKSQIYLCLHQEDPLIGNNFKYKKNLYVSVIVFQKGEKSILLPMPFKSFAHNRQFQMTLSLSAGKYLIVPIINQQIKRKEPPSTDDDVKDIFQKLDLLMRRQLKYADLQPFFKVVQQYFDPYIFQKLLKQYAQNRKGIGFDAFKRLWQKNSLYWRDKAIQFYSKQRLFVISLHSKDEVSVLIKSNIGTQLNNRAHCEIINKYGQKIKLQAPFNEYLKITAYYCKSSIIEYMAQNIFQRKIQLQLDCSQFSEYEFTPSSGKITAELDSGQKRYLMKIMPKKRNQGKKLDKQLGIKVKVVQ